MNNEETKVKSFRITKDISDRIKTLCSEFDNQSAAFEALITAYEMQNAKVVLSNRQTEIEDYDVHLHALQKAFLQSLELNHNAEERIRTEFARQLDTKDNTIADYQKRVNELEQEIKATKNKCSEEIKDAVRGMDIVMTTSAKTDEEAKAVLAGFGMPFIKEGK